MRIKGKLVPVVRYLLCHIYVCGMLLLGESVSANPVHAQSDDELVARTNAASRIHTNQHISRVIDRAVVNAQGLIRVNVTAGDGNVQQNSAAIAENGGYSSATIKAAQKSEMIKPAMAQTLSSRMDGVAFSGANGLVQVNSSAGMSNQQFNGAAMAVSDVHAHSFIELDAIRLMGSARVGTAPESTKNAPAQSAEAVLSPGTFKSASGIIQINQTAGNHNTAANSFTMSVSP